jgi:uncharacterized membrane protein
VPGSDEGAHDPRWVSLTTARAESGAAPTGASARAALTVALRLAAYAVFSAAVVWYVAHFARLTYDRHLGTGTAAFDYGLYDQGLWLLSHFHDPFITIMGRNLFGSHTSFILGFLVPLYWIAPGAGVLLTSQALLIGLGAVPVFLYARKRLESVAAAAVLGIAFLLHPAVGWSNIEQFHPDAFFPVTVGLALYGALGNRRRLLVAGVVLSLLVREDVALLTVPLGIWYALRRDRKLGLLIIVGSLAYSAIAMFAIITTLLGTTSFYFGRIPFGGVGGFLKTVFVHPGRLIHYLGQDGRPRYVWQMLVSGGLVFLAATDVALIGIGVLGINVISTFVYEHLIRYHYSLLLVPIVSFASVEAIGRMRQPALRWTAVAAVGVIATVGAYLWGPMPFSRPVVAYWKPNYPDAVDVRVLKRSIPPDAVVSAYVTWVPHVDHRRRIYMFPTPFSASYWGTPPTRYDGKTLPFVHDVEYVFIPTHLDPDLQKIWNRWRDKFVLDRRMRSASLYRRADLPSGAG